MKVSDLMAELEKGDRTMEHLKTTQPQSESITFASFQIAQMNAQSQLAQGNSGLMPQLFGGRAW